MPAPIPAFRAFLRSHGANAAGWLWLSGGVLQIGFGAATGSPPMVAAAAISLSSSACAALFGRRTWGVPATCALIVVGITLTLLPGLAALEPGAVAGWIVFTASMAVGFFSGPLAERFEGSASALARRTLGVPRRFGFGMTFASRLPVIAGALAASPTDWRLAAIFLLCACGDLAAMESKPPKA